MFLKDSNNSTVSLLYNQQDQQMKDAFKLYEKAGFLVDFQLFFLREKQIQISPSYNPGDEIQAMCLIECRGKFYLNAIAILIKGRVKTKFHSFNNFHHELCTDEFFYFVYKHFLYGNASGQLTYLDDGRHDFIFRFKLPERLPSSFNHRYGSIKYYVQAFLVKPKHISIIKKYFNVVSLIDLSSPQFMLPVGRRAIGLTNSCLLSLFCCQNGFVGIYASTDKTGYLLGDVIHVVSILENYMSTSCIPRAKLYQIMIFHASNQQKVCQTRVKSYFTTSAVPGRSRIRWRAHLKIPKYSFFRKLPGSVLNCPLIRVTYFVRVSLSNCHLDLPVYIDDFELKTMYVLSRYKPINPPGYIVQRYV